ncbi:MAG: hypothetical protein CMJ64_19140 [Planctomycetaceae bacterium]|nr:hypothetical protein [Planctomycetaceae bacterium]
MSGLPLRSNDKLSGPELQAAIDGLESYFTKPDDFRDVSRGKPKPHSLDEEQRRAVGLTRETWKLEIISDADNPARVSKELTKEKETALDFNGLMQLAEKHAVRFPKVMTCLNIGCPLGMGIWEGVPLREAIWLAEPRENLRRVFYYGYHNDDPKQMFRSSQPVGRVLEDLYDLPPIILCYKLNGEWLTPERGGPVRVVVPEGYGFKSIKWLTTLVLSNLHHANDTYANGNNDLDSPLKSFAATLSVPNEIKPDTPFAVTGYAQVGVSGLSKVQVSLYKEGDQLPKDDPYFTKAAWQDVQMLPPPGAWGGGLPDGKIPAHTMGFEDGRPASWPMKLAKVHWATLMPALAEGKYRLRSRTVDANGHAQPMPRPFRKSGHATIEQVRITVKA